jgi:choline dehydrogenase-like flavoprotein
LVQEHVITSAQAAKGDWDVIIVGAGMGGCAAAYALSKYDLKILVLEKGQNNFAEPRGLSHEEPDPKARLSIGRWPTQVAGEVDGQRIQFWPPLGCGVGGSTQLYAAALDRFRPSDFAARVLEDGRDVSWPFGYDDIAPFYAEAEAQLRVRGTPDPADTALQDQTLPAPPEMSDEDAWFFARFESGGLNPYRLHCGVAFKPDCTNCLGTVCLRDCKRTAANGFLEPALATGRVRICPQTEVTRLHADAARVTSMTITCNGQEAEVQTNRVILASGAYFAPVLLLNSRSPDWPDGLANQNDQVGRNLMFHSERRMALWPKKGLSRDGIGKSITVRDFYEDETGEKFGEFQSTGAEARYGNIIYALRQMYDTSRFARVPVLRHFLRVPALIADKLFGGASIFALIVEDYPYPENRVRLDQDAPGQMRFAYRVPDELRKRARTVSRRLTRAFRGMPRLWLSPEVELNYGHPCGTLRAGSDPATSVVDGDGKAHGLENLYVTCGSVFSTSGGTNPSLTIAAFALRAGDRLGRKLTTQDTAKQPAEL